MASPHSTPPLIAPYKPYSRPHRAHDASRSVSHHRLPLPGTPSPSTLLPRPASYHPTPPPAPALSLSSTSAQVPFKPGFQPSGISRHRTSELSHFRKLKQESKRLQESRLQKRLEALILLHFPPPRPSTPYSPLLPLPNHPHPPPASVLESAGSMISRKLVRLITQSANGESELLVHQNLRSKEQMIVRWQEDHEVARCRLCQIRFGFRVRKHHCRLCGLIICFTPSWMNHQTKRCSALIWFEWDAPLQTIQPPSKIYGREQKRWLGGQVIELTDEQMGLRTYHHSQSVLELLSNEPTRLLPAPQNPSQEPLQKKGVRVCRECLEIILRKQSMTSPPPRPDYLEHYQILKELQDDVQRLLPEFQELVLNFRTSGSNLNHSNKPVSKGKLIRMRKRLLTDLALYDSTTKRITNLITSCAVNRSEVHLLSSINMWSNQFLRDRMGLMRSMGSFELDSTLTTTSTSSKTHLPHHRKVTSPQPSLSHELLMEENNAEESSTKVDLIKLNVLLEQERLVEGYLEDARALRRLEDAQSLQTSLDDLREEISQLKLSLQSN